LRFGLRGGILRRFLSRKSPDHEAMRAFVLERRAVEFFRLKRTPNRQAMQPFVLKRRTDEMVVAASMLALAGLGVVASLFGAVASPDAAGFWQNFVGGVALLAMMTLPIWLLQRWQSMARPPVTPEAIRAYRLSGLVLLVLWILGLGLVILALGVNVTGQASLAANVAVGLLIAYVVGWGLLVFGVFRRPSFLAHRFRGRGFGARTR